LTLLRLTLAATGDQARTRALRRRLIRLGSVLLLPEEQAAVLALAPQRDRENRDQQEDQGDDAVAFDFLHDRHRLSSGSQRVLDRRGGARPQSSWGELCVGAARPARGADGESDRERGRDER